jgi:hypothetical protein
VSTLKHLPALVIDALKHIQREMNEVVPLYPKFSLNNTNFHTAAANEKIIFPSPDHL